MRIALCQLNSVVGDVSGNRSRILEWYREAAGQGAGLVVFPELALTGYPPRDLLDLPDFLEEVHYAVAGLATATSGAGLVFGTPTPSPHLVGKPLVNAAVLCAEGAVQAVVGKKLLPAYDVFDETRHFEPHRDPAGPVPFGGFLWGLHVCEDAWNEEGFWPRRLYRRDPVTELAEGGAQILLNISASPFHARKIPLRRALFQSHCERHHLPLLYTNAVGGNDELVLDGEAYVFDAQGELLASGIPFEEEILFVDVEANAKRAGPAQVVPVFSRRPGQEARHEAVVRPELDEIDSIHRALVLGTRDFVRKCGFTSTVLGLSGGIDSAVTAVLAAQALGADQVWGIALPSRYSSPGSLTDAEALARNLGLHYQVLSIEPVFEAGLGTLAPSFEGTPPGIAEENLQARARGMLLMALSNKFGHLLLTTGNKSELAVGYCTLYGDMAGGLAVLGDVPKTAVYALARFLNRGGEVIPQSTLHKPPSAELRPEQKDEDTLPPYEVLDRILEGAIEDGLGVEALVAQGLDEDVVRRVIALVMRAEYKRRQAPPGIKISPKAFGFGRRMPIAARWLG